MFVNSFLTFTLWSLISGPDPNIHVPSANLCNFRVHYVVYTIVNNYGRVVLLSDIASSVIGSVTPF